MEAKNVEQPVEMSDESLEGISGGLELTSAEIDRVARPLYEKGLSGEEVFWTLDNMGFIDARRYYFVTDSKMELTRYLRKLTNEYYPEDDD